MLVAQGVSPFVDLYLVRGPGFGGLSSEPTRAHILKDNEAPNAITNEKTLLFESTWANFF